MTELTDVLISQRRAQVALPTGSVELRQVWKLGALIRIQDFHTYAGTDIPKVSPTLLFDAHHPIIPVQCTSAHGQIVKMCPQGSVTSVRKGITVTLGGASVSSAQQGRTVTEGPFWACVILGTIAHRAPGQQTDEGLQVLRWTFLALQDGMGATLGIRRSLARVNVLPDITARQDPLPLLKILVIPELKGRLGKWTRAARGPATRVITVPATDKTK